MKTETQSKSAAGARSSEASVRISAFDSVSLELDRAALYARATGAPVGDHAIAVPHALGSDSLERLKMNIAQLEDLHGRLKFMMAELSALVKKPSF